MPMRRFTRYSALSLLTVPVAYSLFLLARHFWEINAGILNICVGMVLTLPSYVLYRYLVWPDRGGRSFFAGLFSFWQTVMVGALASSALMALLDLVSDANDAMLILAGLTGQGIIFLARFLWLDKVTFDPDGTAAADQSEESHPAEV
jgi:putative flippase GtrA